MIFRSIVFWVGMIFMFISILVPYHADSMAFDVSITPAKIYPGTIAKVTFKGMGKGPRPTSIRYKGKNVPLVEEGSEYWCLLGIGLDEPPGKKILSIEYGSGAQGKVGIEIIAFEVSKKEYPKEYLKVPKKMVEFPKPILQRILDDQAAIRSAVSNIESRRYFSGPFIRPVNGAIKSTFGLRRYFNNKPRSPHSGVDLAAPIGTPVAACNSGKVVLVRDCYLSGWTVVIDHGLGLYSLYAHLKKVFVTPGQTVKKGQKIALSGMSGRATGPHLHWGISLYGNRLDPLSLLKIF